MAGTIRVVLVAAGTLTLALAAGFFLQLPWATQLWPLPAGRLSNIFVASIFAAIAAPLIWIGLVGEGGALTGGAINLGVTHAGTSLYCLWRWTQVPAPRALLPFAVTSAALALVAGGIVAATWSRLPRDGRATPPFVRLSFALFAIILGLTGSALVGGRPNVFPWPISRDTSVIYGWIFLGAMCYFAYALFRSNWGNACGQLLGFLAYDLVLIQPYVALFRTVKPELRVNLAVYTAVLVCSGLVAAYYLFINRATRFSLRGARPAAIPGLT